MKIGQTQELLKNNSNNRCKVLNPYIYTGLSPKERLEYIAKFKKSNFDIKLLDKIIKYFFKYYKIEHLLPLLKTNKQEVVEAKHWVIYFAYNSGFFTKTGLKLYFGYKSHATLTIAINTLKDKMKSPSYKAFKKDYPIHIEYFKKNFNMFVEEK